MRQSHSSVGGGEKYRIGARIGGGGMAEVYRGQLFGAEGFQRPVAIKRILTGLSNDESFAKMFVREARLASLLTHPNIASVIDFDRDEEGYLFIVMELVEGKDLRALFESGEIPISVATYVVAELLRALDYAHRLEHDGRPMRLVHRDVSPHNVLLSWQGGVKLTDFGIAKALAESPLTQTGVVKGKAAYLAPEQAQSQGVDNRSDLFAVGVLLHELLSGERLFGVADGAPEMVVLRRVLSMAIPPPSALRSEISTALDHVCLTLLAREPNKRYPTAGAALEALLVCPEFTARGQLELASLVTERFRDEAPSESSDRPHVPAGRPRGDFTNPDLDVGAGPSSFTDIEALKSPDDFAELQTEPPSGVLHERRTERVVARPYLEAIPQEPDLVETLPEDRPGPALRSRPAEVAPLAEPSVHRQPGERPTAPTKDPSHPLEIRAPALRWVRWYAAIAVLLVIGVWAAVQLIRGG